MVAYGLSTLPLIHQLKSKFPELQQAWYADGSAVAGPWDLLSCHFHCLTLLGSTYGYFPKATKSDLVVSSPHQSAAQAFFSTLGLMVCSGHRYLGGFIGESHKLDFWLLPKIDHWLLGIHQLTQAAQQYPHAAYAALQRSLQMEWQYLQWVVKDCKPFFSPLKDALFTDFLDACFSTPLAASDPCKALAPLPVKLSGLAIYDPLASAYRNYKLSLVSCTYLFSVLHGCTRQRAQEAAEA